MNILFVCKYNVFRSRVAEEYFRKINGNPKIKTASRGFIMGGNSDADQRKIAREILEVNIAKRKPLPVTLQELIKADLIIVVASDIPKIMFDYSVINLTKKVIIWNIKDEQKRNKANIKKITLLIKDKVEELNGKLEKRK
jgi:protein-tyrosine-phosphatase